MSFADANALINAVAARMPPGAASANMEQLFSRMMGIAMEEIQKAKHQNAYLPKEDFTAGYDAMLARIDTSGNPGLAKAISDYRAARTPEERDALKATLAGALDSAAQAAEQRAFNMLGGGAAADAEEIEEDEMPTSCPDNCDESKRPFNHLLHILTDDAIQYALDEAEANPQLASPEGIRPISDRKRIDYLRDYLEKERVSISDLIEKFIEEGCSGFAWAFLTDLPEFRAEIPKYYKCRGNSYGPRKCLACTCFIENSGTIAKILHPDLIVVEHYPSIMTHMLEVAIQEKDFTNMNVVYEHFRSMPNFSHYHEIFRQSVGDVSKLHKYARRWFKSH